MTERWDQITPRWITAQRRLLAAPDTTPQHHAVLAAVLYQTAARQHFTDRTSLGQVARNAGLWTDPGPCSRHRKRLTGQILTHLHAHSVLTYEALPGPAGCIVTLPEPDPTLLTEAQARAFMERASDPTARAAQETREPLDRSRALGARERLPADTDRSRAEQRRSRVNRGDSRSVRAESDTRSRAPGTRASEGSSEGSTRGRTRAQGGPSNGPAEGGPTTTTPTGAERRNAARHTITTNNTDNPLAVAHAAITRPDPQGELDDGYLDELEHAISRWTYGVTEAETAIALDTLDRTDNGTHPLQAAHQAAQTWAAHPARDHDTSQLPRPPKDLRP